MSTELTTTGPGRTPPHDLAAERSMLGAMLIDPRKVVEVADVPVNAFYLPAHREVWAAMTSLYKRGIPIDVVPLADELKTRGVLARLDGGEAYLITLAAGVPTAENVRHYAEIVRETAARRAMLFLCTDAIARAYSGEQRAADLFSSVQRDVNALAVDLVGGARVVHIAEALDEALAETQRRRDRPDEVGVRTGFTGLDVMTCGLQPEEFMIVAGQPGAGKTAFAGSVLLTAARAQRPVLLFSLEMRQTQQTWRLLAGETGINSREFRSGEIGDADWKAAGRGAARLGALPIWMRTGRATLGQVEAEAAAWAAKIGPGLKLVIVDYIQRVRVPGMSSPFDRVTETAMGMKNLAVDLKVPVVGISSMNRGKEGEGTSEPQLHHLRASGDLEYEADTVLFLKRDAKATTEECWAELILAKSRNGATGKSPVWWDGPRAQYLDNKPDAPREQERLAIQQQPDRRLPAEVEYADPDDPGPDEPART